jgi:predicted nucleic acid-binding protein
VNALPNAVLDSSVVVAGLGWRGGPARQVLVWLAVRGFVSWTTPALAAEWAAATARVAAEVPGWGNANWAAWLDWLRRVSRWTDPVPLRATVRRDPADDAVLAAALGARAGWLVTYDKDLLSLRRPFGIRIVSPGDFLEHLAAS